jgi:hypothetical protein
MTTGRINQVTFLEQRDRPKTALKQFSRPTGASLRVKNPKAFTRRVLYKFPRIEKKGV